MFLRLILAVFLVLFLAGCATTGKSTNTQGAPELQNQVQELQARISFLEEELQGKDQEISYLESELEKTPSTETSTTVQLSVRQVQTALKNAGFYKGSIDGKLGKQTKDAIKKFQKAHGLKTDGVVGKRTASELSKHLAK